MEVVHAEFAVALLGNDEFGSGLAAVFAMNKRDCVGIPFDLSAVGKCRGQFRNGGVNVPLAVGGV